MLVCLADVNGIVACAESLRACCVDVEVQAYACCCA